MSNTFLEIMFHSQLKFETCDNSQIDLLLFALVLHTSMIGHWGGGGCLSDSNGTLYTQGAGQSLFPQIGCGIDRIHNFQ